MTIDAYSAHSVRAIVAPPRRTPIGRLHGMAELGADDSQLRVAKLSVARARVAGGPAKRDPRLWPMAVMLDLVELDLRRGTSDAASGRAGVRGDGGAAGGD